MVSSVAANGVHAACDLTQGTCPLYICLNTEADQGWRWTFRRQKGSE